MAKAFIGGVQHAVHVDRDLGESWAVSVVPAGGARVVSDQPVVVVKLQGNDRASVLKGGLELLVKSGHIERYELDPSEEPAPPPEKPAAPAAKPAAPAAAKAADPAPAAAKPDAKPADAAAVPAAPPAKPQA